MEFLELDVWSPELGRGGHGGEGVSYKHVKVRPEEQQMSKLIKETKGGNQSHGDWYQPGKGERGGRRGGITWASRPSGRGRLEEGEGRSIETGEGAW